MQTKSKREQKQAIVTLKMAEDKTNKALRSREFFINNLKRHQSQLVDLQSWSKYQIEERISKVQKNAKSVETQTQIIICEGEQSDEVTQEAEKVLDEADELALTLIDTLKKRLHVLECEEEKSDDANQTPKPSGNEDPNAKKSENASNVLPEKCEKKLEIMRFTGDQAEWITFSAWLEQNVSKNDGLKPAEKLNIVLEATSNSPVEMILDGAVSYEQALVALEKTYNTTFKTTQQALRLLKRMRLNVELPAGEAIWKLIKETDNHLSVFTEREIPGMEYIITLIVLDKLDPTTQLN